MRYARSWGVKILACGQPRGGAAVYSQHIGECRIGAARQAGWPPCGTPSEVARGIGHAPAAADWMTGIEEFHREITAKGYKYLRPGIDTTFYDARCVRR